LSGFSIAGTKSLLTLILFVKVQYGQPGKAASLVGRTSVPPLEVVLAAAKPASLSRATTRDVRGMAVDQASDPRRLAGDVSIMSAVADAGRDQLRTVEAERSGCTGHDPSLRRQTIERIIILAVGNENVHTGRIHGIELRSIPSRDGPSQS
jgi:hypothetical protein